MKEYIIGAFLAFALMIGIQLSSCNRNTAEGAGNGKRIDSVLVIHHDTLIRIDSVLKIKIKRIETMPDTEIVNIFDTIFADTGHSDTVKTTVYAERECLKCVDSLQACKNVITVDSSTIDSLAKIGKEKAPESGGLIHDLKVFGSGFLV